MRPARDATGVIDPGYRHASIDRRCTRRRRAFARLHVARAAASVLIRGWQRICLRIRGAVCPKEFSQKRPAPSATRSGAVALRQLALALRLFDAQEVYDFALRDVETQAQLVIEFHAC